MQYKNQYHTGYYCDMIDSTNFQTSTFRGRGWSLIFEKRMSSAQSSTDQYELLIDTNNASLARRSYDQLKSAISLYTPMIESDIDGLVDTKDLPSLGTGREQCWLEAKMLLTCCVVATKCSHRLALQFALAKFRVLRILHPYHDIYFDPSYIDYEHLGKANLLTDSVCHSYAIVLAYSIIEDLGLQIIASQKEPSKKDGRWNPVVLRDLKERLTKSGIDISEDVLWIVRGKQTAIQKHVSLQTVSRPAYAVGPYVRDKRVDVCDAIYFASNFRSKVASHASSKRTRLLSPFDVNNVLRLVRHLLLCKLQATLVQTTRNSA